VSVPSSKAGCRQCR